MSENIKRPNTFIVGAPKCGTTSLAAWLSDHPQIFMSSPKEPNHFNSDLININPNFRYFEDRKEYEDLFSSAKAEHEVIGEASARYLYSSCALSNILDYNRNARFIVMARNPLEMVVSLHNYHVFGGSEDIEDLEKAWDLQADREEGRFIPRLCNTPQSLQYGAMCSIGKQIKRMFELIPREQRHVIVLDDLKRNPLNEWKILLHFLGVNGDGRTQFPIHNGAKRLRSKKFRNATRTLKRLKGGMGLPPFRLGLLNRLDSLNRCDQTNKPMSIRLQPQLKEYFRQDIKLLEELLERDFSGWLAGSS